MTMTKPQAHHNAIRASLAFGLLAIICHSLELRHALLASLWSMAFFGLVAFATHNFDPDLDHRKVSMPQPRRSRYNRGSAMRQFLLCLAAVIAAHVFLIVLHLICFAVFGMQEPRW